jgi:hypothetical protein
LNSSETIMLMIRFNNESKIIGKNDQIVNTSSETMMFIIRFNNELKTIGKPVEQSILVVKPQHF